MSAPLPSAPGDDPRLAARVVLRPLGSPIALTFVALAGASLATAGLDLAWVPLREQHQVGLVLLAFAFPLQLLGSAIGFLTRESVASTGMGVLGGTWLAYGLVLISSPPGSASEPLGLLLVVTAAAMLLSASAAAFSGVGAETIVLVLVATRFLLGAIYELSGSTGVQRAAGGLGVAVAAVALAAAWSTEIESVLHRPFPPMLRFRKARQALAGDLPAQLEQVENEPGVRTRL